MSESIVHVVDDDAALRESLAFLLESAGFEVTVAESAVEFLTRLGPDLRGCILTDIRMPEMDGIELLRHVRNSPTPLPVVVMTGHGDVPVAVEAMKLGAVDFVEKPFDDEVLLRAIREALARGEGGGDPSIDAFKTRLATLTGRERQVFDGLLSGEPNKVIARRLDISPRTVEVYRAGVMTKMEAGSVSELVRLAVKAGLA